MRAFVCGLFIFVIHQVTYADNSFAIQPTVTIGTGVILEKNNDAVTESTRLPLALGLGASYLDWSARLEYSSFRTADGNSTISVQRAHEIALLWGAYEFSNIDGWMPYAAVGTGAGRSSMTTRMATAVESADGPWEGVLAFAVGFRANWMSRIAVRPEARIESAERYKIKDARMGVFIQLDILL